ncbi:sodium-coupled monocarboxylate transporter 2 isoform X1 [Nilaparvata lugens]|uniref:sodium-coupled monocarboxylate transporter 2 isoform X1 n=2 Tax=Nilaparvata lugens TaxID=108931 RepID=UPI00193E85F5|nr:sodium-coupled monocarboxylate transporter 2 isoform X1 [Nilaparvata lugens]
MYGVKEQIIPVFQMENQTSAENPSISSMLMMFNWIEYLVFSLMLGLSALIGVYYGCYKGNQNTVSEYMQGGKKMGIFPITMSLIASHVSGITLLGVPAEIYRYGTQYYAIVFCIISVTAFILLFYLPVFFKLQLNSPYEYLERRFSYNVRVLASFAFSISLILYIPVVIYVPALAFNQVTGMSVHTITPIVCLVCIFYTTLGGLKAVVWSDALQSVFTFGSVLIIIAIGCSVVGGPSEVFRINNEGHRLEVFNMDTNPFARNTFWTITIGMSLQWIAHLAIHPGAIQRFIAVPTYRDAQKVTLWVAVGLALVKSASVFTGLLVYSKYHDCDPIAIQVVNKPGQILPYYVMDIAGRYPGITGVFISGVVSAALSTMSASLNTVAGTIYEDFVLLCFKNRHSDAVASFIMKCIVLILGAICVALVLVVEKLGGILQMAISLSGVTNGALAFVFSFGMFYPWANAKGAMAGLVASLLGTAWIVSGAQAVIADGRMKFPGKINIR